ncbi:MAG: (d)CMP kinase, partial [Candidatus Omnitrophica bacterium]|nr:(d)CMP kinase [Candidatus Omnitrophota bacterium]
MEKTFLKVISIIVVVTFTATNIAWGQPDFAHSASSVPHQIACQNALDIPKELGIVDQDNHYSLSTNDYSLVPDVIYIQSAHTHFEAQSKIAEIIKRVAAGTGAKTIAVEGASGSIDLKLFRSFPDEETKKKVLGYYLKKGELTGAEYAAVFGKETSLVGVEDKTLFDENYKAFREASEAERQALNKIKETRRALNERRKDLYPPKLLTLAQREEEFVEGACSLSEFLPFLFSFYERNRQVLTAPDKFETLKRFNETIGLLGSIDSKEIERDAKRLYELILERDPSLKNTSVSFMLGGSWKKRNVFVKSLVEQARALGIDSSKFKAMSGYADYVREAESIDGIRLLDQVRLWIKAMKECLFRSDAERSLDQGYSWLAKLSSVAKLEALREDAILCLENENKLKEILSIDGARFEQIFRPALRFYELALKRDEALYANLSKLARGKKPVIFVTGGFHVGGITERLRQDKIRYAVITPMLEGSQKFDPYRELLNGKQSEFTQFLRSCVKEENIRTDEGILREVYRLIQAEEEGAKIRLDGREVYFRLRMSPQVFTNDPDTISELELFDVKTSEKPFGKAREAFGKPASREELIREAVRNNDFKAFKKVVSESTEEDKKTPFRYLNFDSFTNSILKDYFKILTSVKNEAALRESIDALFRKAEVQGITEILETAVRRGKACLAPTSSDEATSTLERPLGMADSYGRFLNVFSLSRLSKEPLLACQGLARSLGVTLELARREIVSREEPQPQPSLPQPAQQPKVEEQVVPNFVGAKATFEMHLEVSKESAEAHESFRKTNNGYSFGGWELVVPSSSESLTNMELKTIAEAGLTGPEWRKLVSLAVRNFFYQISGADSRLGAWFKLDETSLVISGFNPDSLRITGKKVVMPAERSYIRLGKEDKLMLDSLQQAAGDVERQIKIFLEYLSEKNEALKEDGAKERIIQSVLANLPQLRAVALPEGVTPESVVRDVVAQLELSGVKVPSKIKSLVEGMFVLSEWAKQADFKTKPLEEAFGYDDRCEEQYSAVKSAKPKVTHREKVLKLSAILSHALPFVFRSAKSEILFGSLRFAAALALEQTGAPALRSQTQKQLGEGGSLGESKTVRTDISKKAAEIRELIKGNPVTVTIDGPAGVGKTTLASNLARCLRVSFLPYGKIFRLASLLSYKEVSPEEDGTFTKDNLGKLVRIVSGIEPDKFDIERHGREYRYFYDGKDITKLLEGDEVANFTPLLARLPEVRPILVRCAQGVIAEIKRDGKSIVLEGRVTGAELAPEAKIKIFLNANVQERASRRAGQLVGMLGEEEAYRSVTGRNLPPKTSRDKIFAELTGIIEKDIVERDKKDTKRELMPLEPAAGAVIVDNSGFSEEDTLKSILNVIFDRVHSYGAGASLGLESVYRISSIVYREKQSATVSGFVGIAFKLTTYNLPSFTLRATEGRQLTTASGASLGEEQDVDRLAENLKAQIVQDDTKKRCVLELGDIAIDENTSLPVARRAMDKLADVLNSCGSDVVKSACVGVLNDIALTASQPAAKCAVGKLGDAIKYGSLSYEVKRQCLQALSNVVRHATQYTAEHALNSLTDVLNYKDLSIDVKRDCAKEIVNVAESHTHVITQYAVDRLGDALNNGSLTGDVKEECVWVLKRIAQYARGDIAHYAVNKLADAVNYKGLSDAVRTMCILTVSDSHYHCMTEYAVDRLADALNNGDLSDDVKDLCIDMLGNTAREAHGSVMERAVNKLAGALDRKDLSLRVRARCAGVLGDAGQRYSTHPCMSSQVLRKLAYVSSCRHFPDDVRRRCGLALMVLRSTFRGVPEVTKTSIIISLIRDSIVANSNNVLETIDKEIAEIKKSECISTLAWKEKLEKLNRRKKRLSDPISEEDNNRLTDIFSNLEINDLTLGTRQYIKMRLIAMYLSGEDIAQIPLSLNKDIEEAKSIEKKAEGLSTTGAEIGFPVELTAYEKEAEAIEVQCNIEGGSYNEKITNKELLMRAKAGRLAIIFNYFMDIERSKDFGVRPCDIEEDSDQMDLRILPSNYEITRKVLDIYIRDFNLFTPDELISSSYATTVSGLLYDKRGVLIAVASFYLDKIDEELEDVFLADAPISQADGLGHPGLMPYRAIPAKARTSQTVGENGEVSSGHAQMTFNYHMLSLGFEILDGEGKPSKKVLLQYPGDYGRISHIVSIALDKEKFDNLILKPVLSFYRDKLDLNEKEITDIFPGSNPAEDEALRKGSTWFYNTSVEFYAVEIAQSIASLANLLRIGFLTRPLKPSETLNADDITNLGRYGLEDLKGRILRSQDKIYSLFKAHQDLWDGIAKTEVQSKGQSLGTALYPSIEVTRRKRQQPAIQPRKIPRPAPEPATPVPAPTEPAKEPVRKERTVPAGASLGVIGERLPAGKAGVSELAGEPVGSLAHGTRRTTHDANTGSSLGEDLGLEILGVGEFIKSDFKGPIVLGGTGFIGSHLVESLAEDGRRVAVVFRSRTSPYFRNLAEVYDNLRKKGKEKNLVLVEAGNCVDPMDWPLDRENEGSAARTVEQLKGILSKATVVFHLAAASRTRPEGGERYLEFASRLSLTNVFFTKVITSLVREVGKSLVYASSAHIFALRQFFGKSLVEPVIEIGLDDMPLHDKLKDLMKMTDRAYDIYAGQFTKKTGLSPLELAVDFSTSGFLSVPQNISAGFYSFSKVLPERSILEDLAGGKGFVVRFTNVYGPRSQNDVIHTFLSKLMAGPDESELIMRSEDSRNFIAVHDAVGILRRLSEKIESGKLRQNELIHAASGEEPYTMRRLLETVAGVLGKDLSAYPVEAVSGPNALVAPRFNIGKLQKLLGYTPQSLEEGIHRLNGTGGSSLGIDWDLVMLIAIPLATGLGTVAASVILRRNKLAGFTISELIGLMETAEKPHQVIKELRNRKAEGSVIEEAWTKALRNEKLAAGTFLRDLFAKRQFVHVLAIRELAKLGTESATDSIIDLAKSEVESSLEKRGYLTGLSFTTVEECLSALGIKLPPSSKKTAGARLVEAVQKLERRKAEEVVSRQPSGVSGKSLGQGALSAGKLRNALIEIAENGKLPAGELNCDDLIEYFDKHRPDLLEGARTREEKAALLYLAVSQAQIIDAAKCKTFDDLINDSRNVVGGISFDAVFKTQEQSEGVILPPNSYTAFAVAQYFGDMYEQINSLDESAYNRDTLKKFLELVIHPEQRKFVGQWERDYAGKLSAMSAQELQREWVKVHGSRGRSVFPLYISSTYLFVNDTMQYVHPYHLYFRESLKLLVKPKSASVIEEEMKPDLVCHLAAMDIYLEWASRHWAPRPLDKTIKSIPAKIEPSLEYIKNAIGPLHWDFKKRRGGAAAPEVPFRKRPIGKILAKLSDDEANKILAGASLGKDEAKPKEPTSKAETLRRSFEKRRDDVVMAIAIMFHGGPLCVSEIISIIRFNYHALRTLPELPGHGFSREKYMELKSSMANLGGWYLTLFDKAKDISRKKGIDPGAEKELAELEMQYVQYLRHMDETLTSVINIVETLKSQPAEGFAALERRIEHILRNSKRMVMNCRAMLQFMTNGSFEDILLRRWLIGCKWETKPNRVLSNINTSAAEYVKLADGKDFKVKILPDLMHIALERIISNGFHAMKEWPVPEPHDKISVTAEPQDGSNTRITVSSPGRIEEGKLGRLFNLDYERPIFNHGIGLPFTARAIQKMGGTIEARNVTEDGYPRVEFVIRLRQSAEATADGHNKKADGASLGTDGETLRRLDEAIGKVALARKEIVESGKFDYESVIAKAISYGLFTPAYLAAGSIDEVLEARHGATRLIENFSYLRTSGKKPDPYFESGKEIMDALFSGIFANMGFGVFDSAIHRAFGDAGLLKSEHGLHSKEFFGKGPLHIAALRVLFTALLLFLEKDRNKVGKVYIETGSIIHPFRKLYSEPHGYYLLISAILRSLVSFVILGGVGRDKIHKAFNEIAETRDFRYGRGMSAALLHGLLLHAVLLRAGNVAIGVDTVRIVYRKVIPIIPDVKPMPGADKYEARVANAISRGLAVLAAFQEAGLIEHPILGRSLGEDEFLEKIEEMLCRQRVISYPVMDSLEPLAKTHEQDRQDRSDYKNLRDVFGSLRDRYCELVESFEQGHKTIFWLCVYGVLVLEPLLCGFARCSGNKDWFLLSVVYYLIVLALGLQWWRRLPYERKQLLSKCKAITLLAAAAWKLLEGESCLSATYYYPVKRIYDNASDETMEWDASRVILDVLKHRTDRGRSLGVKIVTSDSSSVVREEKATPSIPEIRVTGHLPRRPASTKRQRGEQAGEAGTSGSPALRSKLHRVAPECEGGSLGEGFRPQKPPEARGTDHETRTTLEFLAICEELRTVEIFAAVQRFLLSRPVGKLTWQDIARSKWCQNLSPTPRFDEVIEALRDIFLQHPGKYELERGFEQLARGEEFVLTGKIPEVTELTADFAGKGTLPDSETLLPGAVVSKLADIEERLQEASRYRKGSTDRKAKWESARTILIELIKHVPSRVRIKTELRNALRKVAGVVGVYDSTETLERHIQQLKETSGKEARGTVIYLCREKILKNKDVRDETGKISNDKVLDLLAQLINKQRGSIAEDEVIKFVTGCIERARSKIAPAARFQATQDTKHGASLGVIGEPVSRLVGESVVPIEEKKGILSPLNLGRGEVVILLGKEAVGYEKSAESFGAAQVFKAQDVNELPEDVFVHRFFVTFNKDEFFDLGRLESVMRPLIKFIQRVDSVTKRSGHVYLLVDGIDFENDHRTRRDFITHVERLANEYDVEVTVARPAHEKKGILLEFTDRELKLKPQLKTAPRKKLATATMTATASSLGIGASLGLESVHRTSYIVHREKQSATVSGFVGIVFKLTTYNLPSFTLRATEGRQLTAASGASLGDRLKPVRNDLSKEELRNRAFAKKAYELSLEIPRVYKARKLVEPNKSRAEFTELNGEIWVLNARLLQLFDQIPLTKAMRARILNRPPPSDKLNQRITSLTKQIEKANLEKNDTKLTELNEKVRVELEKLIALQLRRVHLFLLGNNYPIARQLLLNVNNLFRRRALELQWQRVREAKQGTTRTLNVEGIVADVLNALSLTGFDITRHKDGRVTVRQQRWAKFIVDGIEVSAKKWRDVVYGSTEEAIRGQIHTLESYFGKEDKDGEIDKIEYHLGYLNDAALRLSKRTRLPEKDRKIILRELANVMEWASRGVDTKTKVAELLKTVLGYKNGQANAIPGTIENKDYLSAHKAVVDCIKQLEEVRLPEIERIAAKVKERLASLMNELVGASDRDVIGLAGRALSQLASKELRGKEKTRAVSHTLYILKNTHFKKEQTTPGHKRAAENLEIALGRIGDIGNILGGKALKDKSDEDRNEAIQKHAKYVRKQLQLLVANIKNKYLSDEEFGRKFENGEIDITQTTILPVPANVSLVDATSGKSVNGDGASLGEGPGPRRGFSREGEMFAAIEHEAELMNRHPDLLGGVKPLTVKFAKECCERLFSELHRRYALGDGRLYYEILCAWKLLQKVRRDGNPSLCVVYPSAEEHVEKTEAGNKALENESKPSHTEIIVLTPSEFEEDFNPKQHFETQGLLLEASEKDYELGRFDYKDGEDGMECFIGFHELKRQGGKALTPTRIDSIKKHTFHPAGAEANAWPEPNVEPTDIIGPYLEALGRCRVREWLEGYSCESWIEKEEYYKVIRWMKELKLMVLGDNEIRSAVLKGVTGFSDNTKLRDWALANFDLDDAASKSFAAFWSNIKDEVFRQRLWREIVSEDDCMPEGGAPVKRGLCDFYKLDFPFEKLRKDGEHEGHKAGEVVKIREWVTDEAKLRTLLSDGKLPRDVREHVMRHTIYEFGVEDGGKSAFRLDSVADISDEVATVLIDTLIKMAVKGYSTSFSATFRPRLTGVVKRLAEGNHYGKVLERIACFLRSAAPQDNNDYLQTRLAVVFDIMEGLRAGHPNAYRELAFYGAVERFAINFDDIARGAVCTQVRNGVAVLQKELFRMVRAVQLDLALSRTTENLRRSMADLPQDSTNVSFTAIDANKKAAVVDVFELKLGKDITKYGLRVGSAQVGDAEVMFKSGNEICFDIFINPEFRNLNVEPSFVEWLLRKHKEITCVRSLHPVDAKTKILFLDLERKRIFENVTDTHVVSETGAEPQVFLLAAVAPRGDNKSNVKPQSGRSLGETVGGAIRRVKDGLRKNLQSLLRPFEEKRRNRYIVKLGRERGGKELALCVVPEELQARLRRRDIRYAVDGHELLLRAGRCKKDLWISYEQPGARRNGSEEIFLNVGGSFDEVDSDYSLISFSVQGRTIVVSLHQDGAVTIVDTVRYYSEKGYDLSRLRGRLDTPWLNEFYDELERVSGRSLGEAPHNLAVEGAVFISDIRNDIKGVAERIAKEVSRDSGAVVTIDTTLHGSMVYLAGRDGWIPKAVFEKAIYLKDIDFFANIAAGGPSEAAAYAKEIAREGLKEAIKPLQRKYGKAIDYFFDSDVAEALLDNLLFSSRKEDNFKATQCLESNIKKYFRLSFLIGDDDVFEEYESIRMEFMAACQLPTFEQDKEMRRLSDLAVSRLRKLKEMADKMPREELLERVRGRLLGRSLGLDSLTPEQKRAAREAIDDAISKLRQVKGNLQYRRLLWGVRELLLVKGEYKGAAEKIRQLLPRHDPDFQDSPYNIIVGRLGEVQSILVSLIIPGGTDAHKIINNLGLLCKDLVRVAGTLSRPEDKWAVSEAEQSVKGGLYALLGLERAGALKCLEKALDKIRNVPCEQRGSLESIISMINGSSLGVVGEPVSRLAGKPVIPTGQLAHWLTGTLADQTGASLGEISPKSKVYSLKLPAMLRKIATGAFFVGLGAAFTKQTYMILHETTHRIPYWIFGISHELQLKACNLLNRLLIDWGLAVRIPDVSKELAQEAERKLNAGSFASLKEFSEANRIVSDYYTFARIKVTEPGFPRTQFERVVSILDGYMPYIFAVVLFVLCLQITFRCCEKIRDTSKVSLGRLYVLCFLIPVMIHWMYYFCLNAFFVDVGWKEVLKNSWWITKLPMVGFKLSTHAPLRAFAASLIIFGGTMLGYALVLKTAPLVRRLGLYLFAKARKAKPAPEVSNNNREVENNQKGASLGEVKAVVRDSSSVVSKKQDLGRSLGSDAKSESSLLIPASTKELILRPDPSKDAPHLEIRVKKTEEPNTIISYVLVNPLFGGGFPNQGRFKEYLGELRELTSSEQDEILKAFLASKCGIRFRRALGKLDVKEVVVDTILPKVYDDYDYAFAVRNVVIHEGLLYVSIPSFVQGKHEVVYWMLRLMRNIWETEWGKDALASEGIVFTQKGGFVPELVVPRAPAYFTMLEVLRLSKLVPASAISELEEKEYKYHNELKDMIKERSYAQLVSLLWEELQEEDGDPIYTMLGDLQIGATYTIDTDVITPDSQLLRNDIDRYVKLLKKPGGIHLNYSLQVPGKETQPFLAIDFSSLFKSQIARVLTGKRALEEKAECVRRKAVGFNGLAVRLLKDAMENELLEFSEEGMRFSGATIHREPIGKKMLRGGLTENGADETGASLGEVKAVVSPSFAKPACRQGRATEGRRQSSVVSKKQNLGHSLGDVKFIHKESVNDVLAICSGMPFGTVYSVPVISSDSEVGRLWNNELGIEFAVFPLGSKEGLYFMIIQGNDTSHPLCLEALELINRSKVPFDIHNHPQRPERAVAKLEHYDGPDIEKWFYANCVQKGITTSPFPSGFGTNSSDFSMAKSMHGVGKSYIYQNGFGYILYGENPNSKIAFGYVLMEVWQNNNYRTKVLYDDGALFHWGVSILEIDTLHVFREFMEAIEGGAERIRFTDYSSRFSEWDPRVNFDVILREAGFKAPRFEDVEEKKPEGASLGAEGQPYDQLTAYNLQLTAARLELARIAEELVGIARSEKGLRLEDVRERLEGKLPEEDIENVYEEITHFLAMTAILENNLYEVGKAYVSGETFNPDTIAEGYSKVRASRSWLAGVEKSVSSNTHREVIVIDSAALCHIMPIALANYARMTQ